MKKTFLIVLLSALILSLGMVLPLKTFASKVSYQYYYDVAEDVVKVEFVADIKDEDQVSCAEVVNAKIGDTFKGVSGTTYILQEQTLLNEEQIRYLASQDIVVSGEWVECSGDEDTGGSTQGPFYTTEGGVTVTYEYYLGYVPPPPPITETDQVIAGGWIVTYMEPIN
jgi:hypothetical protein